MEIKNLAQEYIDILEWYIEVQEIFMFVLFRDLKRTTEAPLFMRKINNNGIDEIFNIYTFAKQKLENNKNLYNTNAFLKII